MMSKLRLVLASIRFEHSLFALPFAYIGMFLAADGLPTLSQFIWITVAMVGARTVAMAANRLVHAKEDAANPRTKDRHIPLGLLKRRDMLLMMLVSMGVFVFAASQLNTLALALSPLVIAVLFLYTYAKYFTWGSHFILGWADAIAPAGAWVGVTGTLEPQAVLLAGAVAFWVGGFDIIYACMDFEFDRKYGDSFDTPSVRHQYGAVDGAADARCDVGVPAGVGDMDGAGGFLLRWMGNCVGGAGVPELAG